MYDGHDLLHFNGSDDPGDTARYSINVSKIKTFEDAVIILSTVHKAFMYDHSVGDDDEMPPNDTGKEKPGMQGDADYADDYPVDTSKVYTIEDVRLIIDAMDISFAKGYLAYEKLLPYLHNTPRGFMLH